MEAVQKTVIALLKSAITGEAQALPGDVDLTLLRKIGQKHQIVPMLYQGAVNCGIDPKLPEMQKMFQLYCRALQYSEGQLAWIGKLCAAFDRAGVDYMPLKGCILKPMYPKPELRTMGDADILIRMEQYDKIVPLLTELGFEDRGESDHERKWAAPGLNLELHKRLIPSDQWDYSDYYGDGWQRAGEKTGSRWAMSKEDAFIFVFVHFAKHFRGGGAGYRYITDLYVYLREYPELDQAYILGELEKLQMDRFYRHVLDLLKCWFAEGEENETLRMMSQYIYAGGTWGSVESKSISSTLHMSENAGKGVRGRFLFLRKIVFPSMEIFRKEYPWLKKAPWLVPFAWIHRAFVKVFVQRHIFAEKRRGFRAVDAEAIGKQKAFLERIGLEYHYQ